MVKDLLSWWFVRNADYFDVDQTLTQSFEIFLDMIQIALFVMNDSAKVWDIIEVAEAHSLASRGFRSDQGQSEKQSQVKILELSNSWVTET